MGLISRFQVAVPHCSNLGGSYTEGIGIQEEESWPAQAQEFNPTLIWAEVVKPFCFYAGHVQDKGAEYPQAPLVRNGDFGALRNEHLREAPVVYGDTSMRDLLKSKGERAGLTFLDTIEVLQRAAAKGALCLRYDGHPNALAHTIIDEQTALSWKVGKEATW